MNIPPIVFADTSYFLAQFNPRDEFYPAAIAWSRYVSAHHIKMITTEAVLIEWLNAFSHRRLRGIAYSGYRAIHTSPSSQVILFERPSYTRALTTYAASKDKDWSFTDCLSFVTMRHFGITAALTTDHHFAQAGYEALLLKSPPAS